MPAPERVGGLPTGGRATAPRRERTAEPAPKRARGTAGTPRARSAPNTRAQPGHGDRWLRLMPRRASAIAPKAPFVIMVMAVLVTGLAAILWLSTQAATDSYRLETARKQSSDLSYRVEQLRREVAEMDSAPSLARRAQELGLVPAGDPARLVVRPDGSVTVYGKPSQAKAPPTPPPVAPAAPPAQPPTSPPPTSPPPTSPPRGPAGGGGG
jgi:hypothetical protein